MSRDHGWLTVDAACPDSGTPCTGFPLRIGDSHHDVRENAGDNDPQVGKRDDQTQQAEQKGESTPEGQRTLLSNSNDADYQRRRHHECNFQHSTAASAEGV